MIYILEDDDSIRKLVTYALESQGYSAAGFAVPSAFYEELEKRVPSLLLLDIMLPEEDGISILRKLRANPRTADLPVIMLTAKSTEYDHVEGLDAGADDYVAKPFGMMELLARVRAVLRRAADASVPKKTAGIKADVKNSDHPAGMKAGAEGSAGAAASAESNALLPGSGVRAGESHAGCPYPEDPFKTGRRSGMDRDHQRGGVSFPSGVSKKLSRGEIDND